METRIGFVASEKGAEKECDAGLGLRMQKTTKTSTSTNMSLGGKKTMMMMDHHVDDDPSRFLAGNGGFGEEQQHCGGGPLICNTSNNATSMSDIYDVGSLLFPNTDTYLSYNSSGVMMSSANVRRSIPFTASQRQEFETQTMIYKYILDSLPVPPQLLIPITKTTSNFTNSNSSDSEPWRCKRTDGKKWRCSRNVVPEQKYCERHSHKTRPRSRKHVEQQNSHFNITNNNTNNNNLPYSKPSSFAEQGEKPHPAFSATPHDQPRSLNWFLNGHNPAANPQQDWHQIFQTKPQQQGGSIKTPQNFSPQNFFLNKTRHYIDTWSDSVLATQRDHASGLIGTTKSAAIPSALSLSIHGGEERGESGHMGFGIESNLMMMSQWNTDSWDNGSPPGGPLAEALCLGMPPSSAKESSSRSS